jgi:hypothetical protein
MGLDANLSFPQQLQCKHQISTLMLEDLLKKLEVAERAGAVIEQQPETDDPTIVHQVGVMAA